MRTSKQRVQRNRPIRNRLLATSWPADFRDKAMRDALAGELISECMSALKTYGLSKARLVDISRRAVEQQPPHSEIARIVLEAAQRLADLIAKWGEDPAYLDSSGRPAALGFRGRHAGFARLANEFFPNDAVSDVLQFGCEAKAIERVGHDKVACLNDCVVFTGNSLLILAYSVRTIRRYLSTANFNRQQRISVVERRPDRSSTGEISDKDLAEFIRVMRPQISDIVDMSNRWLANRAAPAREGRLSRRLAGIQAFLFTE
jgi:hypothetical protein